MRTIFLLVAALLLVGRRMAPEHDIAIENVSVVDVETGKILTNHHFGIRDGKIAYDTKFYGLQPPPEIPMTTQERAYTSPIWYDPDDS
jgi:hypothetical protein